MRINAPIVTDASSEIEVVNKGIPLPVSKPVGISGIIDCFENISRARTSIATFSHWMHSDQLILRAVKSIKRVSDGACLLSR